MKVIPVTERREIHVQRKRWRGQDMVDIRTYIKTENYEGYTRKGIMIPIEVVEDVIAAIIEEAGI